jgi:hypothetical protein
MTFLKARSLAMQLQLLLERADAKELKPYAGIALTYTEMDFLREDMLREISAAHISGLVHFERDGELKIHGVPFTVR